MSERNNSDELFMGSAVANGVIRFTSVSQIKTFDAQSDGCPRKWAFHYVLKKKLKKTKALDEGVNFAEKLEHYLKTGEEVLPPVLQAAKHLFPAPGADLEVERPFATGNNGENILKAIRLRDALLKEPPGTWSHLLLAEIKKFAGLVIHGVPVVGAADVRHRRGVFIDENGVLRAEAAGMIVVETGDLKTVSRIHPQKVMKGKNAGTILPTYAKNAAAICDDVQMLGYGVYAADLYPDSTHQRLSHFYANKTKREAAKRTGLISVDQLRERFRRVEGLVLEMIETAGISKIEDVEPNTRACDSFTHVDPDDPEGKRSLKGCGHRYYCPLSTTQIASNMFGNFKESQMVLSAFDMIEDPTANGVGTQQLQLQPQMDAVTYNAAVDAEKQRLAAGVLQVVSSQHPAAGHPGVLGIEGYKPGQPCNGTGHYASSNGQGFIPVEPGHTCAGCSPQQQITMTPSPPPPVPPAPSLAQQIIVPAEGAVGVKPPDAPKVDWIDAARPMPPEEIAKVENVELRAKLELHSKLWHERDAQREATKAALEPPVESKWCQPQSPKIVITADILAAKKFVCHCGKSYSVTMLKPLDEGGKLVSFIPKHKPVNKTEQTALPPSSAPALPPADIPSQPSVEVQVVTTAPPPPAVVFVPSPPAPPAPPPPALLASPTPSSVGEMTKMVESMFGPALVSTDLNLCPPPAANSVSDMARAIIDALLPFLK